MAAVHQIFFNIRCRQQGVNVHVRNALGHLVHQGLVGDVLHPQHIHRRLRRPSHPVLLALDLGALEPTAHQGGAGTHTLYKGVPCPLGLRLILRPFHAAFFLSGHGAGQHAVGQHHRTAAVHHGRHRLVHGGLGLDVQVPDDPLEQVTHLLYLCRHRPGDERPQDVIVEPLALDHPFQPAHRASAALHQDDLPAGKLHTVDESGLQPL